MAAITNGNGKHHNGNGKHSQILTIPGKGQPTSPPHNLDAEMSVLGSILIEPDMIIDVAFLAPADFYLTRHGWIFDVLRSLSESRRPMDLITIQDELERRGQLAEIGGPAFLTDLINLTPTSMHAAHYGRIVYRDSVRRRIILAASEIAQMAHGNDSDDPEEILGSSQATLLNIEADRFGEKEPQPVKTLVNNLYDRIESLQNNEAEFTGLPTGLVELDKLLSGLRPGRLYVMAGRPGMGKSGLALTMSRNMAKAGIGILYFSLEMSRHSVVERLVAGESGVNSKSFSRGKMTDDQWQKFIKATSVIEDLPIYVDDQPNLTAGILRSRSIRQTTKHDIGLIIVDHMGKVRHDDRVNDEYKEASYVSNALLSLAKELKVPVLALCQMSRAVESTNDKKPKLWHLRDSGRIEEDADTVMFVYRDEYYKPDTTEVPNMAELIVAKNRDGETGIVQTYYQKQTTTFFDLAVEVRKLNG